MPDTSKVKRKKNQIPNVIGNYSHTTSIHQHKQRKECTNVAMYKYLDAMIFDNKLYR